MSISVIIPFYNETIFLEAAVRSVLGLGDRLHQVLIIDDSPGRYPQTLDAVRALDSRIEVVTNARNMGASATRNEGLRRVTGGQVLFLDSDDVIASKALLKASERMTREGADLVHIPTMVMDMRTSAMFRFPRDDRLFGTAGSGLSCENFPDIRYALANWSFLFNADYLSRNAIGFDPEQRMFEDHLFILNAVEEAENIALLGSWGHLWRKRGGSLTMTNYNAADRASQAASIRKSLGFLASRHGADSHVVQRDVAFCLSRYVMTWPTLGWALGNAQDTYAEATLDEIADAFRPYRLTAEACESPAMERLFGPHLRLHSGPRLATARLHEVFETLVAGDWPRLASLLQVAHDEPATRAPVREGLGILCALDRFHQTAKDSASEDVRMFSEVVFDELDEWMPTLDALSDTLALAQRFSKDCAKVLSRRLLGTHTDGGEGATPSAQDLEAFQRAFGETNRYLSETPSDRGAGAIDKAAIADLWRVAETALSAGASNQHALADLANRAVHGDSDIRGRRKIKARARLLLRNVVPSLRP